LQTNGENAETIIPSEEVPMETDKIVDDTPQELDQTAKEE